MGNGQLTTLQLLLRPSNTVYVIKKHMLRFLEHTPASEEGHPSLSDLLQSKSIWKVGFHLRDLSKVLFHQHKISLDGVYDLQLMELASRGDNESKKYLAGFSKCVDQDIAPSNTNKQRWLQPNETTDMHLFNSLGHVPWDTMRRVELFGDLWAIYRRKLGRPGEAFWLRNARFESIERVKCFIEREVSRNSLALGPTAWWDYEMSEAASDAWNDEIQIEINARE